MIAIIIIIVLSDLKWLASKKTGIFTNRKNNPMEKEEQKQSYCLFCAHHMLGIVRNTFCMVSFHPHNSPKK